MVIVQVAIFLLSRVLAPHKIAPPPLCKAALRWNQFGSHLAGLTPQQPARTGLGCPLWAEMNMASFQIQGRILDSAEIDPHFLSPFMCTHTHSPLVPVVTQDTAEVGTALH